MKLEGSGCCTEVLQKHGVTAELLPTTIVQLVGNDVLVLDLKLGEVLRYSPSEVSYHPSPIPHLAVVSEAQGLLHDLHARGLVANIRTLENTLVTRRTVLGATGAVAGGAVFAMALPTVAVASSVARRPGFWAINEFGDLDPGVDRSEPIRLYVWIRRDVFPEIANNNDFEENWFVTIEGQVDPGGPTDDNNDTFGLFLAPLAPGTPLHSAAADFEEGGGEPPTFTGTVTNGAISIPVLFTHDPDIPPGAPDA